MALFVTLTPCLIYFKFKSVSIVGKLYRNKKRNDLQGNLRSLFKMTRWMHIWTKTSSHSKFQNDLQCLLDLVQNNQICVLCYCRKHLCYCAVCITNVSSLENLSRTLSNRDVVCNLHIFIVFIIFYFRPTFRRIIRNHSTEQFSGLPYVYSLLNCLICLWYGLPYVTPGIILVATVNSIGAIFQLVYIIIFIAYAEKTKKVI